MLSGSPVSTSHRRSLAIGGTYLAVLLLLLGVALFHFLTGHPIAEFTRDPAALMDRSPLVGCLSKLGMLLWTGGAAIALFTAALLPRGQRPRSLLAALSAFTALLLFDDLFMLHEYLGPRHLGLSEEVFIGLHSALGLALLLHFRNSWLLMPIGAFVASGLLLGSSILADLLLTGPFQLANPNLSYFVEDGLKLMGIAGWTGALVWGSAQSLPSSKSHSTARVNGAHVIPEEEEAFATAPPFIRHSPPAGEDKTTTTPPQNSRQ